jgi:hypothetical protein
MAAPTERAALHAYLDADTRDTFQTYADDNGVSVTGLLEAFGRELAADIEKAIADGGDAMDVRQDWVKAARKIDVQRRKRGGS